MSGEDLQRQTSINIQEKANLIWVIADKLVGLYKPHVYGKVIFVGDHEQEMEDEGIVASIYDMAMGTCQMLACLDERFRKMDPEAEITCYGQELNPQTYGIAKADMLIKGGNADNMRLGDTLGDDQFKDYQFDYIISNPPFGIDREASEMRVKAEHKMGEAGCFAPGLPAKGDGQMLFMLNGVAELKDSEIIPWKEDIAEYLDKNVRPYAPDFWYNEAESKIGYEIPFTREFYKYTPLTPSSVVFDGLKKLEERESELMSKILG